MIVLHANHDLEATFRTLIKTLGVRVEWNSRFIIMRDLLILEGPVRSLYFQFDNRQVVTNIIELDIKEDEILEISEHPKLQDLLNMVLYVFGKWGTLKGIKVHQDYNQLNQLFAKLLSPYYIEPQYRKENFRFYREGIRLSYEDVFQFALESEEKPPEETEEMLLEEEEAQGLWHSLIWMRAKMGFQKKDTTLAQRLKNRLGHNFYMVGYQCPICSSQLHMVVYPVGKEQRIDTEEDGVFMARAYTCDACNCFYTPRPGLLLAEGDIYELVFGADRKAYEDYLDLLGKNGARTSNYKFNEFEDYRKNRLRNGQELASDKVQSTEEALEQLEQYTRNLDALSDNLFERLKARIEENFYPDAAVAKHEKHIVEQTKKREELRAAKALEKEREKATDADRASSELNQHTGLSWRDINHNKGYVNKNAKTGENNTAAQGKAQTEKITKDGASVKGSPKGNMPDEKDSLQDGTQRDEKGAPDGRKQNAEEKKKEEADAEVFSNLSREDKEKVAGYQSRLGTAGRLSRQQRGELKHQILSEKSFNDRQRRVLLRPIEEAEVKEQVVAISRKIDDCEKKSYAQIRRVYDEVEREPLPVDVKKPLLTRLKDFLHKRGKEEVKQMMEKMPQNMSRREYKDLANRLAEYGEDVDISSYQETIQTRRGPLETEEIEAIIDKARKSTREDYVNLMGLLEAEGFAEENVDPYMGKLKDRMREMDKITLDSMCGDVEAMDFDTAAGLFDKISEECILPELKEDVLEKLKRRLERIRVDECELLVQKLQDAMHGRIKDHKRHLFYPARKAMMKEDAKELGAINHALSTYGRGREPFEYPILVVDTSRGHNGKDGMILTPEHIFYNTMLNHFRIPVERVEGLSASTGLLNKKIQLEEKNGAKHKLPYAVDNGEMAAWADILEEFIHYLQEKPASRKIRYLVKENHQTVCCFRCGFVYPGGGECPKCGYKKNQ